MDRETIEGMDAGGVEVFDQGQARALEWLRRDDNVAIFVSVVGQEGNVETLVLSEAPQSEEQRQFLNMWFDRLAEVVTTRRTEICGPES